MSDKKEKGNTGEQIAADFLKDKGYAIVCRNYRFRRAEIDIIAQKDNWLLFVEVKARSSNAFGEPETFVTSQQTKKIFEAAEEYIYSNDWHGHIRFDIISVKFGLPPEVIHFEDAIN